MIREKHRPENARMVTLCVPFSIQWYATEYLLHMQDKISSDN